MTAKAQTAALNAIKQLTNEVVRKSSALAYYYDEAPGGGPSPPPLLSLDQVEEAAMHCFAAIDALIAEYSLPSNLLTEAKATILEALYNEAGRRKDFTWQAALAKRHHLE